MGDFLTFFESGSGGRKKLASLSKTSPEKKTTWNILVRTGTSWGGWAVSSAFLRSWLGLVEEWEGFPRAEDGVVHLWRPGWSFLSLRSKLAQFE